MSFDRRIQDRLYSAEQVEIINSEAHLAGDLRNILDEKALVDGVHINLGDNPEMVQRILDLLGLEDNIGASKYFNVMSGIVRSGGSTSNMSQGRLAPVVEAHGVIGAIELMQTNQWTLTPDTFPQVRTMDERVMSWLMFIHGNNVVDDTYDMGADPTTIIVGASVRYSPECIDEYGQNLGAVSFYESVEAERDYRKKIARMGELLEYEGATLELPSKNYFLRVGQHRVGDGTPAAFGFSPIDIYPRHGFYDLKDGRIVQSAS